MRIAPSAGVVDEDRSALVLLDQLRKLHDAIGAGAAVPMADPALYVARIEGGITALEAVLNLPPSLPA